MSTDLETFHNDLRAAVQAGVDLEIGSQPVPGASLSIEQLEELESQFAKEQDVPERYKAAIETWQTTGSMIPILEGLSIRKKAWKRIGKLLRGAMAYVLLIAILAIAAMVHYKLCVLPEIEAVRQDLAAMALPGQVIGKSYAGVLSTIALVLFVVIFLLLVWWTINGGVTKAGWGIGGGAYMRCHALAAAARTTQLLVAAGVEPSRAASIGSSLAGLDSIGQGELLYTIEGLKQNELTSPALSDYLLMIAERQFLAVRTWGPGVMVVLVGGFFAVMFALLAYGPFASLLGDLSKIVKA